MSSSKSTVTRAQRRRVFKRDDDVCQLCGQYVDINLTGTLEAMAPCVGHIVARSAGGDDSDDNIQTCHNICNWIQGTSRPEEFAQKLRQCEPIFQAWQRMLAKPVPVSAESPEQISIQ